ncbi:MAG: hypothetical protein NT026_00670 [Candidatus Staskawiczbacteria bacterium]|nr:hypothetical protein [Candidatus Staskawiczbacteria bacterium]
MESIINKNLNIERWQKLSLSQQLANIGSEVSRTLSLKQKGDKENMEKSFFRAIELIDLTIADKRWKNRVLEIFKLREVVCDLFFGKNVFHTNPEFLKNYFLFFALNNMAFSK